MKNSILIILCIVLSVEVAHSQEIDFGSFSSTYYASVTSIGAATLDFGPAPVFAGSPSQSIDINSGMVFEITGIRYLDVFVSIVAGIGDPTVLTNQDVCSVNCTIPLTLYAGYANKGLNLTSQAVNIPLVGNLGTAQFQLKERTGGTPPGPPPTPVYGGYNLTPFEENAYIYVYAALNDLSGPFTSGTYQGNLILNVTYD